MPPAADLARELQAAARGDESAWRTIVALYARRVYALAKSRLRQAELAEEVTQSVFCTVASKLGRGGVREGETRTGEPGGYTERGRFEAWLFRIAVNRIRDESRRTRRHARPTDPAQLGLVESTAYNSPVDVGNVRLSAELDALRQALLTLSPPDREIIELRHHAGLSFNQMSEVLSEPLGTLLARHHRALRKLKEVLSRSISPAAATEEDT
ncbi:MAG: RNA polymerase sigma factor [Phycisphaerales bacterium]